MQCEIMVFELRACLLEDIVEEDDQRMLQDAAGFTDRIGEADFRATVRGQILDEEHTLTLAQISLDARIAPESLGLFADINHRQVKAIGDPSRERYPGRFATRDNIEGLEARAAHQFGHREIHQCRADARIRNQFATIDVDGARKAGCERERRIDAKMNRLDFQQHLCR